MFQVLPNPKMEKKHYKKKNDINGGFLNFHYRYSKDLNCFEISRVTASKDLNKLESLNLINKVKKGRSYIYYVK